MSDKLIKEIKQKKPTLQELKVIFTKNKITSVNEIHELMLKHNLLKYVKKDNQFTSMKEKADKNVNNAYKELSGKPFKNAIKSYKSSLKLSLKSQNIKKKSKKTRKNKVSKK